jgi:hypothetical protein
MQIALSGEDEYEGGKLLFATGAGFVQPLRPAGGATIHTGGIVHGVTAMVSGVCYGLYFCDTVVVAKDDHQLAQRQLVHIDWRELLWASFSSSTVASHSSPRPQTLIFVLSSPRTPNGLQRECAAESVHSVMTRCRWTLTWGWS